MCGIAGYYGLREIPEDRIQACLKLMGRRGPDHAAHGRWTTPAGGNVYLLHTRLNIIDLDPRSNQPFRVGFKWMVYNGELYNYLEVREELAARGHRFRTASDTEVLLRALDHYGWAALDRCEGMWAFAVYDEADGGLWLCRDRFGEKPLYVYGDDGGVYFGSEAKFIAALLARRLPIDWDHVYRYLANGYRALYKAGRCFFEELREVPPGSLVRFAASGEQTQRAYWEPASASDEAMSFEEAVIGVRERLIRAVELRLRADVPLAFCMSGGVDSNSLISVAKRVFDYDVHGFTIVNSDARYDELELVTHAAQELGVRHTSIPVDTAEFLPRLRVLVRQHDAPVYTISYFAHWMLMEAMAAAGYRISVSGTGADELVTGYYDHHLAYLSEIREDPEGYRAACEAWTKRIQPLVRNPYLGDPDLFVRDLEFRGHLYPDADTFAKYLRVPWSEPFRERRFTPSLLRNRMLNEMFHETVPVMLHDDDLNAMYFSIENRSPYLDRSLFEFCYRVPGRHLIRDGAAKVLLREAMRGIAPTRILDNPRKVGFNAPILSFLDLRDPAVRAKLLDDSAIFEHIRKDAIETLVDRPFLSESESKYLFTFVSAKAFVEEFSR